MLSGSLPSVISLITISLGLDPVTIEFLIVVVLGFMAISMQSISRHWKLSINSPG